MRKLGLFYAVLSVMALLGAGGVIAALYSWGSASVPGWRSFFRPGSLSIKHAFLDNTCEACHAPVRGVEATVCIACHATAAADLAKPSTAFHAEIQDCGGCHVEHEGAARPIRMDHGALLRLGGQSTGSDRGHPGHPGVARQIAQDVAVFLGVPATASAEREALDCASCHGNRDPHRELFGRDCAGCHATATWRIAGYLHPSPTSTDCVQCHQAPPSHYMMHFGMMSRQVAGQEHAQVTQCYLCHRTDSWNDIKGVGWYEHH